ncbi:glycosyltransferase [Beijerinckia indica]|nr:glycosyltransferase [Beijerinckia indica]
MIVDFSRIGEKTTGVERISIELFNGTYLDCSTLEEVRAKDVPSMIFVQWVILPWKAFVQQNSLIMCPGFPPSIALSLLGHRRVIPYIHDMFLLNRPEDLNIRAKFYMRPSFWFALRYLRSFLVNSEYTASALRQKIRKDAEVIMLRPAVRNIFHLSPEHAFSNRPINEILKLVSLGTIEPRKDYLAAARVRRALAARLQCKVELHIVGRNGWGTDSEALSRESDVFLHGYKSGEEIRILLEKADVFLATSKDEGLGLPLLEVQHGGLAVVAANIPPFREVLGAAGKFIDTADADSAANIIATMVEAPRWREHEAKKALANVARWNAIAIQDRDYFRSWLKSRVV